MSGAYTERLVEVAQAARAAGHGQRGAIYEAAAAELGVSVATIKSRLGELNGRQRKRRDDAGEVTLSREDGMTISTYMTESVRGNSKRLMSLDLAVQQLRTNGLIAAGRVDESTGEFFPLSLSAIVSPVRPAAVRPSGPRSDSSPPRPHRLPMGSASPIHESASPGFASG